MYNKKQVGMLTDLLFYILTWGNAEFSLKHPGKGVYIRVTGKKGYLFLR